MISDLLHISAFFSTSNWSVLYGGQMAPSELLYRIHRIPELALKNSTVVSEITDGEEPVGWNKSKLVCSGKLIYLSQIQQNLYQFNNCVHDSLGLPTPFSLYLQYLICILTSLLMQYFSLLWIVSHFITFSLQNTLLPGSFIVHVSCHSHLQPFAV